MRRHDAVVIGGGPAGLSAAAVLHRAGIRDVLVIEREDEAGGLPRDCDHPGFGLGQFHRLYTGPRYARRLVDEARGVEVMTRSSVVGIRPGGEMTIATAHGVEPVAARAVLLATGIRETPRPPRMVSGGRPWGLFTTGALQRWLRENGCAPCRRPVVVGTEWVSFSALHTLRRAGARAVAMIEERPRVTVPVAAAAFARTWYRVPVLLHTRLLRVLGGDRVEGVEIECGGERRTLECDAILFTGRFVPEAALARQGHIALDAGAGGPVVDQHWRCSDPAYFAAGNVLRPVETSGRCGREGEAAGRAMAAALDGTLDPPQPRVVIRVGAPLRYVCPGALATGAARDEAPTLRAQVTRPVRGTLRIVRNGADVERRPIDALPDRQVRIPLPRGVVRGLESLEVRIDESTPSGELDS